MRQSERETVSKISSRYLSGRELLVACVRHKRYYSIPKLNLIHMKKITIKVRLHIMCEYVK